MNDTTPSTSSLEATSSLQMQVSHCWNRFGVYGDSSCSKLSNYIHCRNCPVYSAAGLQLLSRPLPVGYRQECTLHIANQRLGPEANTTSAVVFRIAADWLAIPTKVLQEVAERRRLHSLPHRRKGFILGLANVRGELLLCVSLAHFLELENTASLETLQSTYHWLLAVKWERERFAFPVHEVHGPHRFQFQEEKNAPIKMASSKSTNAPKFVQWQQRTVGLVNPRLLFAALNRNLT